MVELIGKNNWNWETIQKSFLECRKSPLLELGLNLKDIDSLCMCEVSSKVENFKLKNNILIGSDLDKLENITAQCMISSNVQQKLNKIAGLDPNTKPVDFDIDYNPIKHLYEQNGWNKRVIKQIYAASLSNHSLKADFLEEGYSSKDYMNYSICLTEQIINTLEPNLMIANPKKFAEKGNVIAVKCMNSL